MLKKLKNIVAPLIMLLLCVCCAFAIQKEEKAYAAQLNGTPVESSYALNSSFRLDKTTMTIDGTEVEITGKKIYFPNNTVSNDNDVTLNCAGRYTVEYVAKYQGKTYVLTESFDVYESLYSLTSLTDKAEYGENPYAEGQEGVNISLAQNSVFSFNPIIDFSDKTKNDEMIRFNILPERLGAKDFEEIYVRLTDVYDEDNYVTIRLKQSIDAVGDNQRTTSYVTASAGTDSLIGDSDGKKGGGTYGWPYGLWRHFSFSGWYYEKPLDETNKSMSLYFDYKNGDIHAKASGAGDNTFVISLIDNFAQPWKGFKTGEARLSVYCGAYQSGIASFFVESIYDYDLTQTTDTSLVDAALEVDFDEYTKDALPTALVGYQYPVFEASVANKYGNEKLYTTVYYNYNASGRYVVESKDGYFIPDRVGTYTIEYTAMDKYGRTAVETVEVTAVKEEAPIILAISNEYEDTGTIAHALALAEYEVQGGGYGSVKVTVSLARENGETVATDLEGEYVPYESGAFKVVYTAVDFVGQTATKEYTVTIGNGDRAVFEEPVVLPETMIKGMKYTLPTVMANDYTSGTKKQILATPSCEGGTLSGYEFTPTGTEAVITYTASVNGVTSTHVTEIPVKDVYEEGGALNLGAYFDTENLALEKSSDGFSFLLTEEKGRLSFINALVADDMFVTFKAAKDKTSISALTLTLRDYANDDETLRIRFVKGEKATTVTLSGGAETKFTSMDITSSAVDIKMKYNGRIQFGTSSLEISAYENGKPFAGFSSGLVYLTMEVEGEQGNAGVLISNVNGQAVNADIVADTIEPTFAFASEIGGRCERNATVTIPAFLCVDVLNSQTTATLKVESNAGITTATDGTLLEDVDAQKAYEIKFESSGIYILTYTYADGAGNEGTFEYFIRIIDGVAPKISVNTSALSVKAGESFEIATATATDDVSQERKIKIVVFIKQANGYTRIVENGGSVVLEQAGEYTLVYMAVDEGGNYAKVEVSVKAS